MKKARPAFSLARNQASPCPRSSNRPSPDLRRSWAHGSSWHYVRTDPITGNNTNVCGEHPRGWLIYMAEGRMMVIVVPESRKPLEREEDRIAHHKQMRVLHRT